MVKRVYILIKITIFMNINGILTQLRIITFFTNSKVLLEQSKAKPELAAGINANTTRHLPQKYKINKELHMHMKNMNHLENFHGLLSSLHVDLSDVRG